MPAISGTPPPVVHNQDILDAVVTRLPETIFLTHHVYPQVLVYQPEDHGDPLTQPVESNAVFIPHEAVKNRKIIIQRHEKEHCYGL